MILDDDDKKLMKMAAKLCNNQSDEYCRGVIDMISCKIHGSTNISLYIEHKLGLNIHKKGKRNV